MGKDSCKGKRFYNNGIITVRSDIQPEGFVLGRLPYNRVSPSEETREKISESNKGSIAWNKNLKNPYSADTIQQMSQSAKERAARGILPDNTGNIAWNRGLTKYTSESIKAYSEKQSGQIRSGNYKTADYDTAVFKEYQKKVRLMTEQIYKKFKNEINPNGYPRGTAGQDGIYHLDHIIPICVGFSEGLPVETIADKNNLRMLPWKENLSRSKNISACMTELMSSVEWNK